MKSMTGMDVDVQFVMKSEMKNIIGMDVNVLFVKRSETNNTIGKVVYVKNVVKKEMKDMYLMILVNVCSAEKKNYITGRVAVNARTVKLINPFSLKTDI